MQAILRLCSSLGLVVALGCAPVVPTVREPAPDFPRDPDAPLETGLVDGIVRDSNTGKGIVNALVVLQCTCLEANRERLTNERGIYSFVDLPPGDYTVQALWGKNDVSKVFALPKGAKFRANFLLRSPSWTELSSRVEASTY
jgi:hypothetical protein